MSNYTLTKHIAGVTKRLLWRSLSRSLHETADTVTTKPAENSDDRLLSDLPIQVEKNPYEKERVKCILCEHNIEPNYKNVRLLSQFQSRYTGRIYGRHITGLCDSKQKKVEAEIIKAQNAGFMAYYLKDVSYVRDPPLFDPDHPFRPHKY